MARYALCLALFSEADERIEVGKLRFPPFYWYSIYYFRFRPLDVPLYAFGTKNENFRPNLRGRGLGGSVFAFVLIFASSATISAPKAFGAQIAPYGALAASQFMGR